MNEEQQIKCTAFLLALAFNITTLPVVVKAAKKLLAELPPELVSKAAGTPIDFSKP